MLSEPLQHLAERVREASRVVYVCGAGLSVPSGIRAYRSGPDAIWDDYVTEWGTRERFVADPAAWWTTFWLRAHGDLFRRFEPNPGHWALAGLVQRGDDLVITQNIDGLHRQAGHSDAQLIEIHGRHDRFVCAGGGGCAGVDEPVAWVDLSGVERGVIPRCAHCAAPMRPLVLLFDEHYDWHPGFQAHRARKALNSAEVIVFVGTSYSVGITSYAVRCAEVSQATVFSINPEPSPPFAHAVDVLGGAETVLPRLLEQIAPTSGAGCVS